MMQKIIVESFLNNKSHEILNSKFMDCTSDYHFYVDYATVHSLMGCVLGTWNK
jgi:hypothetical protein